MYFQVFCGELYCRPCLAFPIAPARSSFASALRDLKAATCNPFYSLEIRCFESSCNN